MTNKELQEWLSDKPDDAKVLVGWYNDGKLRYDNDTNSIMIF